MPVSTRPEARRTLAMIHRLVHRADGALARDIELAAVGYLREAVLFIEDAVALLEARGGETEYAAWVAAVDRAIDAWKRPYMRAEWPGAR